MARRHRIAAKVTRGATKAARVTLRVATVPVVVVGWGLVLGVLYWQMLTRQPQNTSRSTQPHRDVEGGQGGPRR